MCVCVGEGSAEVRGGQVGAVCDILMVSQGYRCYRQKNVEALRDTHCQDRKPGPLVTNYGNPSQTSIRKKERHVLLT